MKKSYILDGSGYIFRAYYALPELSNSEGKNVNAVYGFFRMLFKLLQEKPDYFIIAWDAPYKTFREEQYEEYKANRVKMPDDFKWQVGKIKEIIKNSGLSNLEIPGYEADDIIYTVADELKNDKDILTYIVSSDKDLKQLISSNVYFFEPMRNEVIDESSFEEKEGFESGYILDYLSLVGDASDNIPGVNGIGKKTAKDLVQQYGTLENIYDNIGNIKSSVASKLEENKDTAFESKSLIKLQEVPAMRKFNLNDFNPSLNFQNIKDILIGEFNFSSLEKTLNKLEKDYSGKQQASLF